MKTSIQMRRALTRLAIASALGLCAAAPAYASFALGFVQNETAGGVPNGDYDIDFITLNESNPEKLLAFSPKIALGAASTLTFKVFVGNEYGSGASPYEYDQFSLWASEDGSSIGYNLLASSSPLLGGVSVPVWGGTPGYTNITVDLSAFGSSPIWLAFSFDAIDDVNNNFPGVRVDDILVTNGGATLFAENFESGTAAGWQLNGLWHVTDNVVPEPSMLSLLGACAIGFGLSRRRRSVSRT
jgi:hypothetical protein